jgi:hypothetical protein
VYYSCYEWGKREARHLKEGLALVTVLIGVPVIGYCYQEVVVATFVVTVIAVNLGIIGVLWYREFRKRGRS